MNNKVPIITIAGKLGSGKSSTAKKVAQALSYEHFSSGDFLRKIAHERGISITELMKDPDIDHHIDEILRNKGDEKDLVIDSRLAFHWIPASFKVYLDIDPDIAVERMYKDLSENEVRKQSEHAENKAEMKEKMIRRYEHEIARYQELYQINHTDHKHFDLVIDTGKKEHDLDTVVAIILKEYKNHLTK